LIISNRLISGSLANIEIAFVSEASFDERNRLIKYFKIVVNSDPLICYLPTLFVASTQRYLQLFEPPEETLELIEEVRLIICLFGQIFSVSANFSFNLRTSTRHLEQSF
jgi:hypothetical protein